MATQKEIKAYLNETGYTREDMQKFFDEAASVNRTVRLLQEAKHNWTNLTIYQISQLPGLKEKTLKQQEERRQKEELEKQKKEKELEAKAFYENNFYSIISEKLLKREPLSTEEISRLVDDAISTEYSNELNRWHRNVRSVILLEDKYYCIDWQQGLTELQCNEFPNQPYEVEKREYPVTYTKTEWIPKTN